MSDETKGHQKKIPMNCMCLCALEKVAPSAMQEGKCTKVMVSSIWIVGHAKEGGARGVHLEETFDAADRTPASYSAAAWPGMYGRPGPELEASRDGLVMQLCSVA